MLSRPNPTDHCLEADPPPETQFVGDVGCHVDPIEDRRVGVRVEAASATKDSLCSEIDRQVLLYLRAGSVRGRIPGQCVRELGESILTSREFLPELGGGEACRVPVICKMVTDGYERVIAEGSEVVVREKPSMVGPEICPPF